MNYLEYGPEDGKAVMLVHGLCSTAEQCYGPIVGPLVEAGYRVVLVEVDGHSDRVPGDLVSLPACCRDIEEYVDRNLDGRLHCLGGFSMGATMAVEIVGRGNLDIGRAYPDAPLTLQLGWRAPVFEFLFMYGTKWLERGWPVPKPLLASVMGKGNVSVVEMLYPRTSLRTIRNACDYLYHYDVPRGLACFKGPFKVVHGDREPYPTRSVELLRAYLPQLEENVYPGLGHGQQLHEHPQEYAQELLEFLAR